MKAIKISNEPGYERFFTSRDKAFGWLLKHNEDAVGNAEVYGDALGLIRIDSLEERDKAFTRIEPHNNILEEWFIEEIEIL